MPAWQARRVAEATIHTSPALTEEAAGWVDAQVAAMVGKVGPAQLDRLVAETIKRFELAQPDPAADPEDGYLHVDPRHATLNDRDVHYAGTMHFEADLDLADALDLDRALAHGAESLKALGSADSLDARRAAASTSRNARSAVVSSRTPGVLQTAMPSSAAAATSTLS